MSARRPEAIAGPASAPASSTRSSPAPGSAPGASGRTICTRQPVRAATPSSTLAGNADGPAASRTGGPAGRSACTGAAVAASAATAAIAAASLRLRTDLGQAAVEDVETGLQILVGHDERHEDADDVRVDAGAHQHQAPLARRARRRDAASAAAGSFVSRSSTSSMPIIGPIPRTSPITAWRSCMPRSALSTCSPISRERARKRGILDLVERDEPGGARQRVAAERAAEAADVRRVHELGAAGDAGQRQAAAERLAPHDQVGLDARHLVDGQHRRRCAPCRSAPRRRCRRCRARGRSRSAPRRSRAWPAGSRPRPAPARRSIAATDSGSTWLLNSLRTDASASAVPMPR